LVVSSVSFGVDIGPFFKIEKSFSSIAKVAMEIERLGFDSAWIPDHGVDPLATLSFIAANTRKIKLGTCVLIPDACMQKPLSITSLPSFPHACTCQVLAQRALRYFQRTAIIHAGSQTRMPR